MKYIKKIVILIFLIITLHKLLIASPVAGVSFISGDTHRAETFAALIESHLVSILKKNDFDLVQAGTIKNELLKFDCTDEKCILNFALNAGLDIVLSGSVIDKRDYLLIKLNSYGLSIPFNGRLIRSYQVEIPLDVFISPKEFSYIAEEHAAKFIAKIFLTYSYPVTIEKKDGKTYVKSKNPVYGRYKVYSKKATNLIASKGFIDVNNNQVISSGKEKIESGDFILITLTDKSVKLESFYTVRKEETVFPHKSCYDTLFIIAVTPLISSTMPLVSPWFGYYSHNDWSGLGFWILSTPPYIYMELRGLVNSPDVLRDKKKDISADDKAMNVFGWYMLITGGMPLFIDSYSHIYHHEAAYFKESEGFLGNDKTAIALSLISNGGGQFYRGNRYWGYLYFHLNNILLYMALRNLSTPEYYDEKTGYYINGTNNKNRGYFFVSILTVCKIVEVIHTIVSRDSIANGENIEESIIPEPIYSVDEKGKAFYGINLTWRF